MIFFIGSEMNSILSRHQFERKSITLQASTSPDIIPSRLCIFVGPGAMEVVTAVHQWIIETPSIRTSDLGGRAPMIFRDPMTPLQIHQLTKTSMTFDLYLISSAEISGWTSPNFQIEIWSR